MDRLAQSVSQDRRRDVRFKVIGFIIMGVMSLFLFAILILPLIAIRLVIGTGKKLGSFTKSVVKISSSAAVNTIDTTLSIVRKTADVGKTLTSIMIDVTFEAISLVADTLRYILEALPRITKFVVTNFKELLTVVLLCNSSISSMIFDVVGSIWNEVNNLMSSAFDATGEMAQMLTDLICETVGPVLESVYELSSDLIDKIKTLTKDMMPGLLDAIGFLTQGSGAFQQDMAFLEYVSLITGLFTKNFSEITGLVGTDTEIAKLVAGQVADLVRSFDIRIFDQFQFCEQLTDIIDDGIPKFPQWDGPFSLNQCTKPFIELGLWWITNGIICKSEAPVTNFTSCFLAQINDIILVPAFTITVGAAGIGFDFPSLSNPVLSPIFDLFNALIRGLPNIQFGWTDITVYTILSNLEDVLNWYLTETRVLYFKELIGTLLHFAPSFAGSAGRTSPGVVILWLLFKIIEYVIMRVVNLIFGPDGIINMGINFIRQWDKCVGFTITVPFIKVKSSFPFLTPTEIVWKVEFCVFTILGSITFLSNLVRDIIAQPFRDQVQLLEIMMRVFGMDVPDFDGKELEDMLINAFGQLTFPSFKDSPFFARTSVGSFFS